MNRRDRTPEEAAIENRGKGIVKQVKGNVKEAWGDLTDNPKTEIEGKVDRAAGRVQEGFGNAIDPNRRRR
ncbi:MAG: CsbD family protein [Acidobacteria bacterium]|nr:MAG: CsbD family protein [Acidobacteriota bacterium]